MLELTHLADDDVVVDGDARPLGRIDDLLGHSMSAREDVGPQLLPTDH